MTPREPGSSFFNSNDDDFVAKMKEAEAQIVIFYGSQTGTAEDFAMRLAGEAKRYGIKALVIDPQDADMTQLSELSTIENAVALFCLATYGEGEPTDNAQAFHDLLEEKTEEENDWLENVNYAVFGLGNKTYEHFNAMATFVDDKLKAGGGRRLIDVGMGDDDVNLEEDFLEWKDLLWSAVCELMGKDANAISASFRTYQLVPVDERKKVFTGEPAIANSFKHQRPPYSQKNPFLAPIRVRRELYKDEGRSCLHIELDISGSGIRYTAGDHAAVYPTNNASLVQAVAERLQVPLDDIFQLQAVDTFTRKSTPFPCPCTYRTALSHYVELTHTPSLNIIAEMVQYAKDEQQKERLAFLCSKQGRSEYNKHIHNRHLTILDVLAEFSSVEMPIDHLLELLPRMQPRYYSISSSSKTNPDRIHMTVAIVTYKNGADTTVEGVATTWFCRLALDTDRVPMFVRRSTFRLPRKPKVPMIMIGPGTGVAPFRGFIQERLFLMQDSEEQFGETHLFFGCQNESKHFMYRDEFEDAVMKKALSGLHTAFSRDQATKVYVQHRLRERKEDVWRVLQAGGHLYICGDAKYMAQDVRKAIIEILVEMGDKTQQQALQFLKTMEEKHRFQQDVWS
ncbi:uncharacterized protein MONBRDRAFT_16143 [Monosiga brevicollis MX1]|uniref:NADPH--hemoprotein reductase n=1 Tax=Monosiga brevicollis TaxID=81824 RepID=A9UW49_MONBE|nr:uncharacterized protein MONBRDRAFT_16143 [Monosiga brevicollis MX1]EDQ90706.1 predicted protein [Monosiga brevicollis MX1]|eukprot:XP_001744757.1 hypothetical protein [Monosiga brevicollis MX1]